MRKSEDDMQMYTVYSQRPKYINTKSSAKPYVHGPNGLIIIELDAYAYDFHYNSKWWMDVDTTLVSIDCWPSGHTILLQ